MGLLKKAAPPADAKVRVEVRTNRRSWSTTGTAGRVTWEEGEEIVSTDVIEPATKRDVR